MKKSIKGELIPVSFTMTAQQSDLLAELAYMQRMNKSELIRQFIDAEAERQGISIGPDGELEVILSRKDGAE